MFEEFSYQLRKSGLKVSLTEWVSLMEALDKGLHGSSFTGFYYLCRCLLVKSEADFDRFDRCFLDYFKDIPLQQEVSQELLDWLEKPNVPMGEYDEQQSQLNDQFSHAEIETLFEERRDQQRERHNRGNYWIGTHGMSIFGNTGMSPRGIRAGGQSAYKRAFRVAGERRFRDFREDATLDVRQFQVALRKLRQFSGAGDLPRTQFDIDNTIEDTARQGGMLKVCYKCPRENTVKILLLMDSGGSMEYYSSLSSALFRAVSKSGRFKDLKIYYFHNCIYTRLYNDPIIDPKNSVPTDWVLSNLTPDWKVILIGDAQMSPYELEGPYYGHGETGPRCGLDWLRLFCRQYPHIVWLNPSDRPGWGEEWSHSYDAIAGLFPMFPLTVGGLETSMKKLLAR